MNTPAENEDVTPVDVPKIIVRNNKVPAKLGAQVIYVLAERDSVSTAGRHRPGVIVDLVQDGSLDGLANIMVFTNAGIDQLPNTHHAKEILHDEDDKKPGTWHWPPPRELVFQIRDAEQGPLEGHDDVPVDEPFPDAESKLDAHIEKKGFFVGEADPVHSPELFSPEEPDSR